MQTWRRPLIVVTVCILAMLAVGSMLLWPGKLTPARGVSEAPSPGIELTGIVRDFHPTHVDFRVVPPLGYGHDAGTVETALNASGRPVWTGNGFRVQSQWRDAEGRPVAPALAGVTGSSGASGPAYGVVVSGTLDLDKGLIDGFDSSAGPYGPGNMGADVVVATNATTDGCVQLGGDFTVHGDVLVGAGGDPGSAVTGSGSVTGATGVLPQAFEMPTIEVPGDDVVGPNLGDVWFHHDPATISANMHVDDLRISTDAVVTVDGNVTIVVEGDFRTETKGVLRVLPGSSLDLYVKGDKFTVETRCLWSDPRATRVWIVGSPEMKIQTDADFYGTIVAPDADLLLQTDADLHGSFVGRSLHVKTGGAVHVDRLGQGGCLAVADAAGVAGAESDGGVHSAASFDQWFRDVLGTNQSMPYTITLLPDGTGAHAFASSSFHPIDGRLYGNEGELHNGDFTYAIRADFTFEACAGQFIEVEGGDGAWVFVHDRLAIDLGGVRSGSSQYVELDRLGLVDGVRYPVGIFYARRDPATSTFRLRTNVELSTASYVPSVTSQYD